MKSKKKPQKKIAVKETVKKPVKKVQPKTLPEPVFKPKIPDNVIENMIAELAGDEAVPVYKLLKGKDNVDEFYISDKLGAPINYIRNIMYKFEQNNLITSTRKKDRKKGWYIYFYTFDPKHAEELIIQLKNDKIDIYKKQLERENLHEFYVCPNRCSRFTLENTMEHNFTCPECGSLMTPEDKEKTLVRIKKAIEELELELRKLKLIIST